MKKIIRDRIEPTHSLHDMKVTAFEIQENTIAIKLQYGMIRVADPIEQVEGYVEFNKVDFDFCNAYVFDITSNTGDFRGKKMCLKDFIKEYQSLSFSVVDETYGYNMTDYSGLLSKEDRLIECKISISHLGDMIFVETE